MPDITRREIKQRANDLRAFLDRTNAHINPQKFSPDDFDFERASVPKVVAYAKYRLAHLPPGLIATAFQYAEICGLLLRVGKITPADL